MKLFDMMTTEDMKRIKAQTDLATRVEELEDSLSVTLGINDELLKDNLKIKKRIGVDVSEQIDEKKNINENDVAENKLKPETQKEEAKKEKSIKDKATL